MDSGDKDEFVKQLRVLFAALDKPVTEPREDAFWRGLARMSLVQFARCCELLLAECSDGEQRKQFTVADVWAAKRRLRAQGPKTLPAPPWPGSHSLRIVNLMFYQWMVVEIRKRTARGHASPRSIPDRELHARRAACLELASTEQLMRDVGEASLQRLRASFDATMARIPAEQLEPRSVAA